MDICVECGLDLDGISSAEVIPRVSAGVAAVAEILDAGGEELRARPAPEVWSVLEYAAHIRDVALTYRELIIAAMAVDQPVKQKMFRELRVDMGMYAPETADQVRTSLEIASRLFANTFSTLSREQLQRTAVCLGEVHTMVWVGAHVIHEVEHHLDDIRAQV